MLILALLVLIVSADVSEQQTRFNAWASSFNKVYQTPEESAYRFQVYQDNAKFVEEHDAEARGFEVALNEFADLTNAEFRAMYNGLNISKVPGEMWEQSTLRGDAPATVDWRNHGAVTGVKNQGQCGSCWAFSTTGSTEGAHFIKNHRLVSLSEQNLVDCSGRFGNMGCNGGLMDSAFKYIIANHGVDTEASYPYHASQGTCKFNPANVGATLTSYRDCPSGSETHLQEFVADAPTSVAIDASHRSFQLYSRGVYNEPACSSSQLDHGVLAVGYGKEGNADYWIVKNSWGAGWGMSGYILMSRDKRNQCGIATAASRPIA